MSQSPTTPQLDNSAATKAKLGNYANAWAALGDRVLRGQSFSGRERNCAFLNTRGPRFATVSAISGFDADDDGRSLGLSDWDGDGDLDVWVGNRTAPRVRLYRNDAGDGRPSVVLQLRGTTANRDAIGARVTVRTRQGERSMPPLVQGLRAGDGFLSQHGKALVFGLGEATAIEGVDVRWPGGAVETFAGVAPGGRYLLTQGSGRPETRAARGKVVLTEGRQVVPKPSASSRVFIGVPTPAPPLQWQDLTGARQSLGPQTGRATLLLLFATWCGPCKAELEALGARASELQAAGLDVVALTADGVDGGEATVDVADWLTARGWPKALSGWRAGRADKALVHLWETTHRALVRTRQPLGLPSAMLVDASGRLGALYQGPVALDTLRADLLALAQSDGARRDHSAAAPGRWLGKLPPAPVPTLDQAYSQAQLMDAAFAALQWGVARDPSDPSNGTRLAALLAQAGDEAGAERVLVRVLQSHPDHPEVHNNLANRLARRSQFAQAVEHYRKALARLPDNAFVLHGLASALANQGQVREALPYFERAVQLDPEVPGARQDLDKARAMVGR